MTPLKKARTPERRVGRFYITILLLTSSFHRILRARVLPTNPPLNLSRFRGARGNLTFRTIVFLALEWLILAKRAVRQFASFGARSWRT